MSDRDALAQATDVLRRTPDVLRALLGGLDPSWTDTPDVPEAGWRPKDVVGHLITGELTNWIPRVERILEHGTTRAFDRFDRFAHAERDVDPTLDELLDRFAELRRASLERLDEIVTDTAVLDRHGLHPVLGEVTLGQLISTWAVHDLDHTAQVYAALAGSHEADVGPWRTFLGILLRRHDPAAQPD
jgi:hypothetical protein